MQSDDIACTLDVCNAEAGSWSHLADNSLCESGQACSPTAGCVAAGAITGTATLYGKTDHSGIVVTVEGLEGATTTTDAMGNWTIVLPPGSYAVTYSKDKYIGEREPNIVVLAEAAERAPLVELMHGELKDGERVVTSSYNYTLNPDRTFLIEVVASAVGTSYYATPTDGSRNAVLIASNPTSVWYTNTHMVWLTTNSGTTTVWSRPLTGASPAVLLGNTGVGFEMSLPTQPRAFTLMRKRNTATNLSQIFVAKTDGSVIHAAPAWTQADTSHPLGNVYPAFTPSIVMNDTHALIGVENYTANPPVDTLASTPFIRVELMSNTATFVNTGFATNLVYFVAQSPDANYLHGWILQNGASSWWRGFMVPISGPAAPSLAPSYGASSNQFSDFTNGIFPVYWLPDSSGIVYQTYAYGLTAGGSAQGDLRVWMTTSPTSSVIAPTNNAGTNGNFNIGSTGPYRLVGKHLIYGDGAAGSRSMKVAAVSANPTSYNLDTSTFNTLNVWSNVDGSYLVWNQAEAPSGTTSTKIMSAALPAMLTATPTPIQLGPNVPTGCSLEPYLSGDTFFRFCNDTRTVAAFAKSSTAVTGSTDDVVGSKFVFAKSNRVGFRRGDGKLYSLGTDLKVVANSIDPNATPVTSTSFNFPGTSNLYSDWLFYRDGTSLMTRASKADGSITDEPIMPCDVSLAYVSETTGNSHVFLPSSRCQTLDYHITHVPTANLP